MKALPSLRRRSRRWRCKSVLRTCSHRADGRIFEHNFVENKEKIRRRTVCTSRIFDAVLGKICRKDVRSTYENKFSAKKQREEQRKTDCRRFYIVGELVVNFFPELNEIKPGTKAQNTENFGGFIKFLEIVSADEKIADCLRDCMQDKPENNGNV